MNSLKDIVIVYLWTLYRFFDLNHRDSNHKNNEDTNIEILCPNCHRLETIELWNSLKGKGF